MLKMTHALGRVHPEAPTAFWDMKDGGAQKFFSGGQKAGAPLWVHFSHCIQAQYSRLVNR